jgi:hypothetical protein
MAFSRMWLLSAAALTALGACATTGDAANDTGAQAAAATPAGSALDAGITAAGGEAALSKVQELYWTGLAKVTTDGKTEELNTAVVVRPFNFYRVTTWAKGAEPKTSKTIQAEQNKAWDVTRVTWAPMPDAAAKFENEQLALFSTMLLAPVKGANVTEQPAAADGTRTVKVERQGAQPVEMSFDAAGKLVKASYSGTDAKTGAAVPEVAKFSGEVTSNGVKWPKRISIERNGAVWYDLEIASFEALAEKKVRPLEQSMQYETGGPPSGADAG